MKRKSGKINDEIEEFHAHLKVLNDTHAPIDTCELLRVGDVIQLRDFLALILRCNGFNHNNPGYNYKPAHWSYFVFSFTTNSKHYFYLDRYGARDLRLLGRVL